MIRYSGRTVGVVLFLLGSVFLVPPIRGAEAAPTTQKTYTLARHGAVTFSVPATWKEDSSSVASGMINTQFTTDESVGPFSMQMTGIAVPPERKSMLAPEELKKIAQNAGQQYVATSEEKKLDLTELKGDSTTGYFFTLTDASADPGKYKVVTCAIVAIHDVFFTVTILHQKDSSEQKTALAILKDAKFTAAANQPASTQPAMLRLAGPGDKWDMVLHTDLFTDPQMQAGPDGRSRQFAAMNQDGWEMTVFFEPAMKTGNATVARDVYWGKMKQSPIPMKDIKLTGDGSAARVEYMIPDIAQKNYNLYLVHAGVWIDVHLSKVQFKDADRAAAEQTIKNATFEKHAQ